MSALQALLDKQGSSGGNGRSSNGGGSSPRRAGGGRWRSQGNRGSGENVGEWQNVGGGRGDKGGRGGKGSRGNNYKNGGYQRGSNKNEWGGGGRGGSNNNNQRNNQRLYNNNTNNSQADRIYANVYSEINRRAKEKAAYLLTTAGGSSPEKAHEQAIAAEQTLLRSWVGPLGKSENDNNGICEYYQDRTKKYPFYTSEEGYNLLQRLLDINVLLLAANMKMILANDDPQFFAAQGELIYEMKPSLKAYNKTWSQEEYGHPGLQRTYIKLKSFQRFTETWATLERSAAEGLFDVHKGSDGKPLRVASIGGGPGYELLAMKMFFEKYLPDVQLELISLDLCPSWRGYVEALGFQFVQWDIHDGNLLNVLNMSPGDLTYVIISYVLIYCSDDPTMDMLANLLTTEKVRAIIVSERSERTNGVSMMKKRGITVCKLMDQSMGQDERQCIFSSDSTILHTTNGEGKKDYIPVFPNVPFSEHKKARQEGGHRLGWRPWHDK
jgi:hypothetical protein